MISHDIVKTLHIIAVVFMAAPLYNLIVVNERVRFGKAPLAVDQYFENIIRGNSTRCYIFQLTALASGVLLATLNDSIWSVITNPVLVVKLFLLLALMGLLSVVHFSLQPQIDRLLAQATGDAIPPPLAAQIAPLRLRRKRLASVCLFLVMTTVVLGLQVYSRFAAPTTVLLLTLAAVFAWRVYRTPVRYGWL
jgi:uncharacterized membrane protein